MSASEQCRHATPVCRRRSGPVRHLFRHVRDLGTVATVNRSPTVLAYGGWARNIGAGFASSGRQAVSATGAVLLLRTPHRSERTEHAAIARPRAQQDVATATFVKEPTGIRGHGLQRCEPAVRAGRHGLECGGIASTNTARARTTTRRNNTRHRRATHFAPASPPDGGHRRNTRIGKTRRNQWE